MYPIQGGIDAKASADALGVGRDHHRDGDGRPAAGDGASVGDSDRPHRIGGRGRFNIHRQVPETDGHKDDAHKDDAATNKDDATTHQNNGTTNKDDTTTNENNTTTNHRSTDHPGDDHHH